MINPQPWNSNRKQQCSNMSNDSFPSVLSFVSCENNEILGRQNEFKPITYFDCSQSLLLSSKILQLCKLFYNTEGSL